MPLTNLKAEIAAIVAEVNAAVTVDEGAILALDKSVALQIELQAKLDAAIAASDPAAIQAAQDEIHTANELLKASTAKLAAAISTVPA